MQFSAVWRIGEEQGEVRGGHVQPGSLLPEPVPGLPAAQYARIQATQTNNNADGFLRRDDSHVRQES